MPSREAQLEPNFSHSADTTLQTPVPEGRENLPFAGKVVVITGGTRFIGAAAAVELAKRGATIIAPHREGTENKIRRANETIAKVEAVGGSMIAPVADLTKPTDRADLIKQIKDGYGKIDVLIMNHAGGGLEEGVLGGVQYLREVNAFSKLDLFQEAEAAGILNDNLVLIDEPANWSKFFHTGIEQPTDYGEIAESKKEGEVLLRYASRNYNRRNAEKGKRVQFGEVCSHGVDKTLTIGMLRRRNREEMKAIAAAAEGGALHSIAETATAIADMAEGKFEGEGLVFVGSRQIRENEMPDRLAMYTNEGKPSDTLCVGSLVDPDGKKMFGFYVAKPKDVLRHFSRWAGELEFDHPRRATLRVSKRHTRGHFNPSRPEYALSLFPGHKQVAGAVEVAQNYIGSEHPLRVTRPRSIGAINFLIPVQPGDRLVFAVTNTDVEQALDEGVNVSTKIRHTEVSTANAIRFEREKPGVPTGMDLDRLIEASAQVLGISHIFRQGLEDVLPLFKGVRGGVEYLKPVLPGQRLEMEAVIGSQSDHKMLIGDVIMRVDDEIVARVLGIDCGLREAAKLAGIVKRLRGAIK